MIDDTRKTQSPALSRHEHSDSNGPSGLGLVRGNEESRSKHIVLTSVSSDSHTWNLVFLQLVLEDMGHRVTNLGACTPAQEVIDVCRRLSPDLLVVSSINGHGAIDGEQLIKRLRNNTDLRRLPAVIGGQLGVRGIDDHALLEKQLLQAGFDAVFQPSALHLFQDFVERISAE